ESEPEPGPESDPGPDSGSERDPAPEPDPESEPGSGSGSDADALTGPGPEPDPTSTPTLRTRLKKHRLLIAAVALAVVATATAVPLVLAASGDGTPCEEIPAATRALAKDPAAATRALDPGDDLSRLAAVRALLVHENPCGDGGEVLGALVDSATRATGPGRPHTMAQARGAYAVAAALYDTELPAGMAPGVARMMAEYIVDRSRFLSSVSDAARPAASPELAAPDDQGWTRYGRFLAPGEAHADFEYADSSRDARPDPDALIAELAEDPEAFAILYDAERAYLAHYLERLTRQGGDPDFRPEKKKGGWSSTATTWPDNDLEDIGERIGTLMKYRAGYAREGVIPDLAEFDAAVRRHTRGVYRPAARQATSRPPMGDIADRPASGPLRGDYADGRYEMFRTVDAWAEARDVPDGRASAVRQIMDDAYVRALWLLM
ncbi:hypothetical protein, partial [Streptomyces phaeofaciens]|uniref:hypothetical protein n=1 Tax=Streptomyces phaeofaciens TaxID=68254 RepID=UPI0036AFFF61